MKLKQITLENFGLFRGRNEIDLNTRTRYGKVKPLVLIGGKNGAGKTTVLESLRLCLYGARALGDRVSNRDYDDYLRGRIHRDDSALINPTSASVGLRFDHSQLGERHEYEVTRSWETDGKKITTYLQVTKDGEPLDDIDQENADEFLRDLIPPGVSQLYFFDGEKIQQLAEADEEDVALSDAIRNLLGLELIDRLQSDLRIYSNRMAGKGSDSELAAKISELTKTIAAQKNAVMEARRNLDEANSEFDQTRQDIAREESRIAREGGAYANKREVIEEQRRNHGARVEELESEIRKQAENLLPFTLVPEMCQRLKLQLEAEQQVQRLEIVDQVVAERIDICQKAIDKILSEYNGQLDAKLSKNLQKEIGFTLGQLVERPQELVDVKVAHNLSEAQRARVFAAISRVETEVPMQVAELRKSLEKETRGLQKSEQDLKKVPSDDQLKPMVEAINELNQQLGAKQTLANQKQTALNSAEFALKDLERQMEKLESSNKDAGKLHEKQRMTGDVQIVLDKYREKLLLSKANQLSEALKNRFSQLWRKGDRAKKIEIDPVTFEVTLFDRHERAVPKKELSAGEKQMFAISILWALADVSGRPLPIVIDTPLGRLDADHRSHLIDRYFPHASHQVIILSTDTEIGQDYFTELKPAMSHAIRLNYDHEEVRTTVEDGYFWKRKEKEEETVSAT